MDDTQREAIIGEVLADLSFTIESKTHREELKQALGGEEEIRALEDFLRERSYEEGEFFESVMDMY